MTRPSLRLASLVAAAALLATVAVLFGQRPGMPELPSSLSSPVTTALLHELALVVSWLLAMIVTLLLLVRLVRVLVGRSPRLPPALRRDAVPGPRNRSLARARVGTGSVEPAFAPPFPLVPRARPEPGRELRPERATEGARANERDELRAPSIAVLGALKIAALRRRRRGLRSQTQQLVTYLALHARGATTDELVAALWPELEDHKAKRRLWESVSDARFHFGEAVVRAGDHYTLDRSVVAVDLDQFDELLVRAEAEREANREQLIERALALVRGQPLAGTDYPWAVGVVHHLRARIVAILEELGNRCLGDSNAAGALAAAERAIALDAYNESVYRLAMNAEAVLGLRQAVVERYERLCQELETGFGLEPERETRLLYRRLLSQDARSPALASR
jgi:DNA-binding SARP family transcriptional activator